MRFTRRTNSIIMWLIAVGLLLGMIITFTPALGNLAGILTGRRGETGNAALLINGNPISELEVARAQSRPPFNMVTEGEVARDLELFVLESLIQQEVLDQAAARVRVGSGRVRQEVNRFREARGVSGRQNDQAYLQIINSLGFTDQTFRAYMREQIRRQSYQDSLTEDVDVTEEEIASYYEVNSDSYRIEAQIRARMIVVGSPELAQELRERASAGEGFQDLASEYSLERADRGGALGAPQGSTDPLPVGRAALPVAVANAAFALEGAGITGVVESTERYYLIAVEEFIPSEQRPFEEIREEVREDALELKRAEVLEDGLRQLRLDAEITIPENSFYSFDNPVVARVGAAEIREAELVYATYDNQQIQRALSPDLAPLIVQLFKPNVLELLIEQELAIQGADLLEPTFIGPRALVAQSILNYVSRDAVATEEDIELYYEGNRDRFAIPASADVIQVTFVSPGSAQAFRLALLEGGELEAAAEESGGEVEVLGVVREGDLRPELDDALFSTDAFEALPDGEQVLSDILVLGSPDLEALLGGGLDVEVGADPSTEPAEAAEDLESTGLAVLVAVRTPETLPPLSDVRRQVEDAVLTRESGELRSSWLDGLRERFEVENLLAEVRASAVTTPAPSDVEGVELSPGERATLEESRTLAAELTEELRALSIRDDLSTEEGARLDQVRADLAEVQGEIVRLTGARSAYAVREGDTLSSIARDFYGDSSLWEEILAANDYLIDEGDLLFPGFILLIPEL
ncbi:MAG: peptidyl-prolyl cis-trans isomerase [Truepera sp.]|nr:peptidyl-prolyl cis-trans isomerase [Truepera sp.]